MFGEVSQQRIAALPIAISLNTQSYCERHHIDFDYFCQSDLYLGYLAGYPNAFDNLGDQLGGIVRRVIFQVCYGKDGEEFIRRAARLIDKHDREVTMGVGYGIPDGERFLQALAQNKNADDSCDSLKSMIYLKANSSPTLSESSATRRPTIDELSQRKSALHERLSRLRG